MNIQANAAPTTTTARTEAANLGLRPARGVAKDDDANFGVFVGFLAAAGVAVVSDCSSCKNSGALTGCALKLAGGTDTAC